jgi:hypothetical protein
MRHLDIKIVVTFGLLAAALGLFLLMESFALNNVPEENVVYIDTLVGGTEDDPSPIENSGREIGVGGEPAPTVE